MYFYTNKQETLILTDQSGLRITTSTTNQIHGDLTLRYAKYNS